MSLLDTPEGTGFTTSAFGKNHMLKAVSNFAGTTGIPEEEVVAALDEGGIHAALLHEVPDNDRERGLRSMYGETPETLASTILAEMADEHLRRMDESRALATRSSQEAAAAASRLKGDSIIGAAHAFGAPHLSTSGEEGIRSHLVGLSNTPGFLTEAQAKALERAEEAHRMATRACLQDLHRHLKVGVALAHARFTRLVGESS